MKVVVVGLGQFGFAAATLFARSGVETIAIDRDMALVERIKDEVSLSVCADATSIENLKAHGVEEADVLVAAIGRDFESLVLAVVHANKLGIPRIIARAASDAHVRVLKAVGTHEVVNPERDAAGTMVQRLLMPESGCQRVSELLSTVTVPLPSGIVGRTLADHRDDLAERFQVALFAVQRTGEEGEELLVLPSTRLQAGDRMHLGGTDTNLTRALQGGVAGRNGRAESAG